MNLSLLELTLFGDVVTLWYVFLVRDSVRRLGTFLLHKEAGSEDSLVELLGLLAQTALSVGPDLTAGLSHGGADILCPLLSPDWSTTAHGGSYYGILSVHFLPCPVSL